MIFVEKDRDSGGQIIRLKSHANIYAQYYERIKGAFAARYKEFMQIQKENFEGGFENVDEGDEQGIKIPYDPKLILVAPAKFSLKEIIGMIDGEEDDEKILDLSPDFQRDYVWDDVRKSRLIESILLNIPLPVFYFARDKDGKLQVVDGVQRLTTIYKFFHNELSSSQINEGIKTVSDRLQYYRA